MPFPRVRCGLAAALAVVVGLSLGSGIPACAAAPVGTQQSGAPPDRGASSDRGASPDLDVLRSALKEELLGDGWLEPAWSPGLVLFVAMEASPQAGRVAKDDVDLEVVRRHPGAAAYYLWRAVATVTERGLSPASAVILFPGNPQVQARWDRGDRGGSAAQAAGNGAQAERQAENGGGFGRDPFDPEKALKAVRVWVDGKPWSPDPAVWARAADVLALDGDRWLGRYRPYSSLGSAPDVSDLIRAQRLYQAALELYPPHQRARAQLETVEAKLEAAMLFARAEEIIGEHDRLLREADRHRDDLAAMRHSFYLWHGADLLERSLALDKALLGASAALERVRRLLGDRPRPPFETAAQLEAELKAAYQQRTRELDYEEARRGGESMRGTKVHLTGRVVRVVLGPGHGQAVIVELLPKERTSNGPEGDAPGPLVYVEMAMADAGTAPKPAEGQVVEAWGELAGNYRYREPSGRPLTVVRVAAAYLEVRVSEP